MNSTDVERSPAHKRVGPQRGRLRAATRALQAAADDPTEREAWTVTVGAALGELAVAWEEHVHFTEAPDGLFDELLDDSVEVAPELDRLKRDHVSVRASVARAEQLVSGPSAGPDDPKVLDALAGILKLVDGHRRRGADLLYQVYSVDPTGGG